MIIKFFEIKKINLTHTKLILFHGKNEGLKNQEIKKLTDKDSKLFSYDEKEILNNQNEFLEEIINKAKKYVFINVACHPAIALLPNGKNAHINLNTPNWWHEKILNFKRNNKELKIICICTLKENGKYKYFPLQYDDKLINYTSR